MDSMGVGVEHMRINWRASIKKMAELDFRIENLELLNAKEYKLVEARQKDKARHIKLIYDELLMQLSKKGE